MSMGTPRESERRREPRIPKILDARLVTIAGSHPFPCRIQNMSKSGATVRTPAILNCGGVLKLEISDPSAGIGRRLLARVMWARSLSKENEGGLRFVEWKEIGKERRRHPRHEIGLFLQYKCLAKELFDWEPQSAILTTISAGGVSISVPRPIPRGATLELKLPKNPLGPAKTIRVKVVRSDNLVRDRWIVAAKLTGERTIRG